MAVTPSTETLDFTWLEHEFADPSDSLESLSSRERHFRPRRSHTKSRNGCSNCKRRRIKCDEGKPDCDQCQRHDMRCHYVPLGLQSCSKQASALSIPSASRSLPSISAKTYSMGLTLANSRYAEIIYPAWRAVPTPSLVETLQHFEAVAYGTTGSPTHQIVLQKHAISLSQDTPFLLHAIFAFSARHLQYLQPSNVRHRVDAVYHRDRALKLFQTNVFAPRSAAQMDACFAGWMILCSLAFQSDHEVDSSSSLSASASNSFLYSSAQSCYSGEPWLSVVAALGQMLQSRALKGYLTQSVLLPILTDIDDDQNSFTDNRTGAIGLPPLLVSICGITESSNAVNNRYHAAVRLLSPMLRIKACIDNFSKFLTFPCRMRPEFMQLYRDKDPVALTIMACWFGQLCGIEIWWCQNRAKTECLAICTYLDGSDDVRIRLLLEGPMRACGYVPIDTGIIRTCVFGM